MASRQPEVPETKAAEWRDNERGEAAGLHPVHPEQQPSLFPKAEVPRLVHFWFFHSLTWSQSQRHGFWKRG
uniref:KIAA1191 n=1 Tax=Sus scrofa TaxID=9823 RepID=A0A8W4F7R5_PIG